MPAAGLQIPCVGISAREGVFEKEQGSSGVEQIKSDSINDWLLFARNEHESRGWDEVLPNYKHVIVDGNHFTIMRQPFVCHFSLSRDHIINSLLGNKACRLHSRSDTLFELVYV
jgi:hypothetical protein